MTAIIVLSVAGIALVLAELLLPGGIIGVIGMILLLAAVVMTFTSYGMTAGIIATVVLLIFGFLTLGLWMKLFHRLPLTKQLLLNDEVGEDEALVEKQSLVGATGTALTDLVPSGRARIGSDKVDVVSEGPLIKRDTPIVVTQTKGPSIIVRAEG